jgi:hypothetical protein
MAALRHIYLAARPNTGPGRIRGHFTTTRSVARANGSCAPDRGSITLLMVVFFVALLAAAGLVLDGGAKLRAAREASAVAEEAARAGAGQVDRGRAYATGGRFVIDRGAAVAAARAYLTSSGNTGTVAVAGAQKIRVTVTISKPTVLLSAIGIGQIHVTKTATADLVQGVEGDSR